jgi:hypothetical protein
MDLPVEQRQLPYFIAVPRSCISAERLRMSQSRCGQLADVEGSFQAGRVPRQ